MKSAKTLPATWLIGRKVRLRPLEARDVPRLRRYRLAVDPKATAFIVQTAAGRDIGALGLTIDGPHAGITIAFESHRRYRDGCAAEALRVMSDGVFRSLPLVRIEALVRAGDQAALAAHRRARFRREGVLRGALAGRAGSYHDAAILSRLRDD